MKRVVSVSLGSSKRDKKHATTILGQEFIIERVGTDGDLKAFQSKFEELDGKVDALGVGGADIYVVVGDKRYTFRQIKNLIKNVKHTPVVDGSGLKHTLEREAINILTEVIDWPVERVLLVSAVDRYGMAQALDKRCRHVVYGDLLFGIGLPIPLRTYASVKRVANLLLPIITKLPFKWFYPTGKKQDERTPKHKKWFDWATVICGDWHYIRRYAPDDLVGKTIITQTLRKADLDWLKSTGAKRAITTTPDMGGEAFATNVMEAVIITLAGKMPEEMTEDDYLSQLRSLSWMPNVIELQGVPDQSGKMPEPELEK
ncbi:MAG: quinate 5-dehydrogenase [Armatimonadetes bacterium]|nr:quinate 5-dehydrogenase [Armatimonadota bacterium]